MGFLSTCIKTGWQSRRAVPESQWDFRQLVKAVRAHRMANPELKLTTDPESIALEVETENAIRLEAQGATEFIYHTGEPMWTTDGAFNPKSSLVIRRTAAIGDVLAATCLVRKLKEHGIGTIFQSHSSTHCVLRRVPDLLEYQEPGGRYDIDLDGVYEEDGQRHAKHFAQMFIDRANQYLQHRNVRLEVTNCTPKLIVKEEEKPSFLEVLQRYKKPWVMICPRSQAWAARTVPDLIWKEAASKINGTCFWLGMNPAPAGITDLGCRHFDNVIRYISCADLMVSVDTGPMHVAAALGIPTIAIEQASAPELHLSDQNDFVVIRPDLKCLNCQKNICPIDAHHPPCQLIRPEVISEAVNRRITFSSGAVSAVIAVYRPDVNKLNRSLEQIVDQVDEVVVASDLAGIIPPGAMRHPRIRYVRKHAHDIGYGRKANFAARHTSGKYLLMLNDDCYLEKDAVRKLKELMTPGVGMVAHLLRYPDGTIQHGGTYRNPGDKGWGHVDVGGRNCRFNSVVEMENVCGASVLIDRKAFYKGGAFDEDFYLYCEDNAMCLQIRQQGYKILFTPHVCGIHEEHQSTKLTPNLHDHMVKSCKTLERKWNWYFVKNNGNNMGTFA